MNERQPAVAGMFYERSSDRLHDQLAQCFSSNPLTPKKERVIAAVVPHAGLVYSGHVAAAVYSRIELPPHILLLGPNHTGLGSAAAIQANGSWVMPFGRASIDAELAAGLIAECSLIEEDDLAHQREHSLEVQLPFIQTLQPEARFVPLCLMRHDYDFCARIGEAIAIVAERWSRSNKSIVILASSDLNHYEDQQITLLKDKLAIDAVLARDPQALWDTVRRDDISMCGILPTITMLVAANALGATRAELVKHATSGDINGEYNAVVGYAGITID